MFCVHQFKLGDTSKIPLAVQPKWAYIHLWQSPVAVGLRLLFASVQFCSEQWVEQFSSEYVCMCHVSIRFVYSLPKLLFLSIVLSCFLLRWEWDLVLFTGTTPIELGLSFPHSDNCGVSFTVLSHFRCPHHDQTDETVCVFYQPQCWDR